MWICFKEERILKKISISVLSSEEVLKTFNVDLDILANQIFAVGYEQDKESTYLATNNWVYMMKHLLSMIKYFFMNYLPISSRWL